MRKHDFVFNAETIHSVRRGWLTVRKTGDGEVQINLRSGKTVYLPWALGTQVYQHLIDTGQD